MAFFGPALILLTLFLFLPMVLTLVFSFTDYFALNPDMTHFVGLENYINIFKDELFVKSFFNTVKFVIIIVPCQCIGALVLALRSTKSHIVRNTSKWHFFLLLSFGQYILYDCQDYNKDCKYDCHRRCKSHLPVHCTGFINIINQSIG